jgi:hypothetical protein
LTSPGESGSGEFASLILSRGGEGGMGSLRIEGERLGDRTGLSGALSFRFEF